LARSPRRRCRCHVQLNENVLNSADASVTPFKRLDIHCIQNSFRTEGH
jgi:hypothetical protein